MGKIIVFAIALALVILPLHALAADQDSNQGNQQQGQSTSQPSPQISSQGSNGQNREETQTQTNNPDTGVMTQEQERTELQVELQESKPSYTPRSQMAQQHMSQVALAVENMIKLASRLGYSGTGDQIRVIARSQGESEDNVNQALDKAQTRSRFAKFFVGPNYKELKEAKQEIEQNRLRIQELNQIMSQISNETDKTELANQIEILEQQNTVLQNNLDEVTSGFSLFGWLSKIVNKY